MDTSLQETLLDVRNQIVFYLPQFVAGIAVFLAFWLASKIVRFFIRRGLKSAGVDDVVRKLLADILSAGIVIFGLVTALGTIGINVAAIIAGLGLTGFALGFALQDIVANTLSGFLLLIYKPFGAGDRIKVGDWEGAVHEVDLRYTTIDTGADLILVPNRKLFEEAITVYDKGGKVKQVNLSEGVT